MKAFLPNIRATKLRKLHKRETDPKVKLRLLACIHRKEGKKIEEIADAINEPKSTVHNWLNRIESGGLERMYNTKNKGADCKLTERQLKVLARDLDAGPAAVGLGAGSWTLQLIRRHIKKKFKVEYRLQSVWDLVRRLGFKHTKPRPIDIRGASREKTKAFKKKAHRIARIYAGRGYKVVSLDEMHVSMQSIIRKGWYRRTGENGENKTGQIAVGVTGRRSGRFTMIGIIGDDGLHYFKSYDTGNMKNVEDFLMRAYNKIGKMLIFTDNASYHSKNLFKKLRKITNGGIVVKFLPTYTPQLAPIESQWREIKRHIANLFFDDIEEIKDAIMRGLKRGLIKIVKLHDYMIV